LYDGDEIGRCSEGTVTTRLKTRLDYTDYAALPDDGKRYEIIEGILHVTPAPSPTHQHAVGMLYRSLGDYFVMRGLGEVFLSPIDLILTFHDVVQPDIVVVAEPGQVSERGIEGTPLLVAEVLSPSTASQDRSIKAQRYAALGIPHYWLVDPEARRMECYRLEAGAYRLVIEAEAQGTVAHPDWPDLAIPLASLWR
jgi:Uma2 family endonuclease